MTTEEAGRNSAGHQRTLLAIVGALAVLLALSVVYALSLSSDLKDAKSAVAARDGSLKLLETDLVSLQARLDAAQQESADARKRATQSESALTAQLSKRPDVPVRLALRTSTLGKGKVVMFRNMLRQPLSVAATFRNSNLNLEKSFRLDFGPDEEKQFGHLEGWQFETGDEITLVNQQFETKRIRVP